MSTVNRIQTDARNAKGARGAAAMKVVSDAKDLGDTFKDSAGNIDSAKIAARIKYAESAGGTGIREQEEKRNPNLKRYNDFTVNKKLQEAGVTNPSKATTAQRRTAENQVVAEGFAKANIGDIRNFTTDTLKSTEFAENTPANKIERAAREMSAKQVDAIQSHIDPTTGYITNGMRKCLIPGTSNVDPTKKDRHRALKDKYNEISLLNT